MTKNFIPVVIAVLVATTACQRGPGGGGADITRDDVPDLTGLIDADEDQAAAAAQLGDPATLRAAAIDQAEQVRGDVLQVLHFFRAATQSDPDIIGQTDEGLKFGQWDELIEGVNIRVVAVRTTEDRVRYVVAGQRDGADYVGLMTGVFVKHAPRIGGGRFHLSLSNVSDLFFPDGDQGADGSLHFLFANHRDDLKGRRVLYLNVDDRATAEADPKSFAADLVRIVGIGGRYRSIFADDMLAQLEGLEAVGMRVAWLNAIGGRADVIVGTQAGGGQIIGHAHECWDLDGLRLAYLDSMPENDATDPNSGDVSNCHDLAQSDGDEAAVGEGGTDNDEELDELLADSGADDVSEDEADDASIP